jgi:hypothetical protein
VRIIMANEEITKPYDGIAPSDKHIHYPVNEPKVGGDGANTLEKIMDRLTALEEGGSGGSGGGGGGAEPLIVNTSVTLEDPNRVFTMDKTWKEIRDAFPNVYIHDEDDDRESWLSIRNIGVYEESGSRSYIVYDPFDTAYQAESENGYPTYEENGTIG